MNDTSTNLIFVKKIIFKYLQAIFCSVLFFIASSHIAYAVDEITAQITDDRGSVQMGDIMSFTAKIGDVIPLMIQVNHPTGYRMLPVDADNPELWEDFEVRSLSSVDVTENPDGGEISRQIVEVTLWETGFFVTPIFPISLTDTYGNLTETFPLPAFVGIVSILQEDDLALRDIKPQATLPSPPLWPWIVAVLLLFILLALIGLWLYRANRRTEPQVIIDTRSPHQIALAEFDQIEAQKLPQQQRFKEHYTQVTDVLRTYLEGAYNVSALGRTTLEIRREMRSIPEQDGFQSRFFGLLDTADLVKFAKVIPRTEDAQEALTEARQIVLDQVGTADLVQLVQDKPTIENIQQDE